MAAQGVMVGFCFQNFHSRHRIILKFYGVKRPLSFGLDAGASIALRAAELLKVLAVKLAVLLQKLIHGGVVSLQS